MTPPLIAQVKFAGEFGCKVIRLRHSIGPYQARNEGVKHTMGKILLFFDSDQKMSKNYVRRLVDIFHG